MQLETNLFPAAYFELWENDLLVPVPMKSIIIPKFTSVLMLHANIPSPDVLKETMTETAQLFGAVPQVPDIP